MALLLASPFFPENAFKEKIDDLELKADSNSMSSDCGNAEIETETSNHAQGSPPKSLETSTVKQDSEKEYVFSRFLHQKNMVKDTEKVPEEKLREFIANNYRKNDDGTLEMINLEQLTKQKKVLGFLLKQFGSALFSGNR